MIELRMKKLILVFTVSLFLPLVVWSQYPVTLSSDAACKNSYMNPVFEPDLADPTIIKADDGYFYAYGMENTWSPGVHRVVPVVRSKDMVHWQYLCDAFTRKPDWKSEGGIWAPCINYIDNKYYLYYSYSKWGDSNPGIGLAISDHPYGPFADQGKVFDAASIGVENSIDPFYMELGDNPNKKYYLFWGSFRGVYGIELSRDRKTTVGEKFKIAGNMFEATYIYPRNGKFYYFGSTGNCCEGADSKYRVSVAVADNIKGPYLTKDGKPILADGQEGTPFLVGDKTSGWVGPGHNGEIITDNDGQTYIVYHAIDYYHPRLSDGATRRPLMIDRVMWDDNGWPYVLNGKPGVGLQPAPRF